MTRLSGDEIARTTADALVAVDPEGVIGFWNHAAVELLGFSADEAIGQTLALIIPAEHRPAHIAGFHRAMESGHLDSNGAPVLVPATRADGSVVVLEMTLAVRRNESGAPAGAVAALRPAGARRPLIENAPTTGD